MTPIEFQKCMQPIIEKENWKRAYDATLMTMIYDEVKHLIPMELDQIILSMRGSLRSAPLVPDFKKSVLALGFRAKPHASIPNHSSAPTQKENIFYWLHENIWADNTHIFERSRKASESRFFPKDQNPDHPYVLLDNQVRADRIKQVKKALENRTYGDLMATWEGTTPKSSNPNLKLVDYSDQRGAM